MALLAGLLYPATAASAKPLSPSVSAAAARSAIVLGAPGGTIPVPPDAYRATEGQLGRHLAAIRMYARWDTPFPDATSIWARDNGRRVLLSVKAGTRAGRPVLYRDIAAATPGTAIYGDISRWAQSLHTFSAPILFTFNHEPEGAGSVQSGTAAEYVAAWRRIVAVFEKSGVTNVSYMFIGTGNGFNPKIARPVLPYYPGDVVDAIGADAYNWYTCRVTPSNLVAVARGLARAAVPVRPGPPDEGLVGGRVRQRRGPRGARPQGAVGRGHAGAVRQAGILLLRRRPHLVRGRPRLPVPLPDRQLAHRAAGVPGTGPSPVLQRNERSLSERAVGPETAPRPHPSRVRPRALRAGQLSSLE